MSERALIDVLTRTVEAIADGKRCRLDDSGLILTIDNRAAALLASALDAIDNAEVTPD